MIEVGEQVAVGFAPERVRLPELWRCREWPLRTCRVLGTEGADVTYSLVTDSDGRSCVGVVGVWFAFDPACGEDPVLVESARDAPMRTHIEAFVAEYEPIDARVAAL